MGAYLAAGAPALGDSNVLGAAVVVGLVVAFGFALNDYCDVEVDALGRAERPLPSGRISPTAAARLSVALAAGAIAIACTLGPLMASFATTTVGLSAAYSFRLKGTLLGGNACMALLVAAVPIYGALSVGTLTGDVLAVAGMSFPYFCAQEILYNVEDIEDDRRAGMRTTAVRLGPRRSLHLVILLLLLYSAVAVVPYAIGIADIDYLVAVLVCSVLPTVAVAAFLSRPTHANRTSVAVKATRAIWLPTVAALLLLK
jgi:geranylgeranylglycerol-phosphate geranylgeranyltransferase